MNNSNNDLAPLRQKWKLIYRELRIIRKYNINYDLFNRLNIIEYSLVHYIKKDNGIWEEKYTDGSSTGRGGFID